MLFGKLLPREGNFFEMFNQHADRIVDAAHAFSQLVANYNDPHLREKYNEDVNNAERAADRVTHDVTKALHKTFITPLDRDDIHQLITRMDDILDLLEDAAQTISLYDIKAITPEAKRLAELCLSCAEKVQAAVGLLSNMDNSRQILSICQEIDRLESDADHVMRAAMSKLFRDEPDVRTLIKLKAIYEILETVTDRCEDVANIIEGIIVENA